MERVIDKVVDVTGVKQRQVPNVQKLQKTVEVLEVQSLDKVVDVTFCGAEAGAHHRDRRIG